VEGFTPDGLRVVFLDGDQITISPPSKMHTGKNTNIVRNLNVLLKDLINNPQFTNIKKMASEFDLWRGLSDRGRKMDFGSNIYPNAPDLIDSMAYIEWQQTGKISFISDLGNTGIDGGYKTGRKLYTVLIDLEPKSNIKITYWQKGKYGNPETIIQGLQSKDSTGRFCDFTSTKNPDMISGYINGKEVTINFIKVGD